jgi:haloalkane dehalogenase
MNRLTAALTASIACTTASPGARTTETHMRDTKILDSFMIHREAGTGPTVVFLHGNPTSSHLWRDVIPHVAGRARCLAPDLIGMGRSGKPDIAYRFADHARYLDAWFDALDLRDVVLVGHDWGGVLAMDWATRHPDRVRGLVVFETFLRPMRWSDWPPQGVELFRAIRTPGVGEQLVLEENQFLARSLEHGIKRGVTADDTAAYNAPFPDAASRRPVLQWPREIPIDGEPADVQAVVERYDAWLATSPAVPKLLLTFDTPSALLSPATLDWARTTIAALDVVALGPAGHHAPEDRPDDIGRAIATWLDRHRLAPAR